MAFYSNFFRKVSNFLKKNIVAPIQKIFRPPKLIAPKLKKYTIHFRANYPADKSKGTGRDVEIEIKIEITSEILPKFETIIGTTDSMIKNGNFTTKTAFADFSDLIAEYLEYPSDESMIYVDKVEDTDEQNYDFKVEVNAYKHK